MVLNDRSTEGTKAKGLCMSFFFVLAHDDLDFPLQIMPRMKKCAAFMDHPVNLVKRVSVLVPSGRGFYNALINHVHASSLLTAKTKQSSFLTPFLLVNLSKDLKWLGGLFILHDIII